MTQEPLTLYKLIVLYMLNRVSFPLTKVQVSDFILERDYTNFLTLQQVFSELIDTNLVTAKSIRNRTHLVVTEEGRSTLHFFENRIGDAIKADVDAYLKDHELEMRNETSIIGNYYKSTNGEFVAELIARDKGMDLINIKLSIPVEKMAADICDNWQKKNQEIYQYLTAQLF